MSPIQAEIEWVIPFHDVDMLRIAWHGHYCKYFEVARCELLERLEYDYLTMKETGFVWPIVDLQIRFIKPAVFMQKVRIQAELVEWEYRMKIRYKMLDAETGQLIAKGHSIQVAVDRDSGEMQYASPAVFLEKVQSHSERAAAANLDPRPQSR